jgi:hypothetical protein
MVQLRGPLVHQEAIPCRALLLRKSARERAHKGPRQKTSFGHISLSDFDLSVTPE